METTKAMESHSPETGMPHLYQHQKRQEWGLAIVANQSPDRVELIFQDGMKRRFSIDFFHFFEVVDRPMDQSIHLINELQAQLPSVDAKGKPKKKSTRAAAKPIPFEQQLEYFRSAYAEGFAGEAYTKKHRVRKGKALKSHRDASVVIAQENLRAEFFENEKPEELFARMVAVVESTDILTALNRKRFAALSGHAPQITRTANALLFAQDAGSTQIGGFCHALEQASFEGPMWETATLFLALGRPNEIAPISAKAVQVQARSMAPGLRLGKRPTTTNFMRSQELMKQVKSKLESEGLEPRDLLDVANFVAVSLSTKAVKAYREKEATAEET